MTTQRRRVYRWVKTLPYASLIQGGLTAGTAAVLGVFVLYFNKIPTKWGFLMVVAIIAAFGVMVIGNLKKILLAVILIDIPLRWDIYFGAQIEAPPLGMRLGWMVALTSAALAGLYLLYILQELVKPGSQPRIVFRENLPLTLYMVFVCLSVFVAHYTLGALYQVFFLAQMYLLYLYIATAIREREEIVFIMLFLLAGLVFEGLIMIGQIFFGLQINFGGIVTVIWTDEGRRAAGTLGSPNVAAGYLGLLIAPAFSLLFTNLRRLYKLLALAAFGLGLIGLGLTLSRGGSIAMSVSMAIFVLIAAWRGKLPVWVPIALVAVAATVLLLFADVFLAQFTGVRSDAALARIHLMQIAFNMIANNPLLGIGANNYAINIRNYLLPGLTGEFIYTVHNKYLLVWAETGIGGIAAFLWFLIAIIRRGWALWRRNDALLSPLALGIMAAVIGQMIHMLVEIFDSRTQVQALWLVAGLLVAMQTISKDRTSNSPDFETQTTGVAGLRRLKDKS
ncbi:MAG: O-antigen ligase family protein [Chloroflexota bacterium]